MAEVILGWNEDRVFTRETLSIHRTLMQLFNGFAAAVGQSFISANSAKAREGLVYMGKETNGGQILIKPAASGSYRGYYYDSTVT